VSGPGRSRLYGWSRVDGLFLGSTTGAPGLLLTVGVRSFHEQRREARERE
jgi:hypothetical protein